MRAGLAYSLVPALGLALVACGDSGPPTSEFPDAGTDASGTDAGGMGLDAAKPSAPDAAPPPALDSGRPPPPEEIDAGKPRPTCKKLDCSKLDDECNVGVCDEDSVTCKAVPVADGTLCGSDVDDACTAPDTCKAGKCRANHVAEGTLCGDDDVVCHFDDVCDDEGVCQDGGYWNEDTACGDPTETECDKPDSCDDVGRCVPRFAGIDAPCGDQGTLCRFDDGCDGLGECKDSGFWTVAVSCPLGEVSGGGKCSCAVGPEPTPAFCHPAPYQCDDLGECISMDEPDGTACGNQTPSGECDNPNACLAGECSDNPKPYYTSCGDPSETTCDLHDVCNGGGSCTNNVAPYGTLCGSPPDECYLEPICDGFGACPAAQPIPHAADVACGGAGSGCLCDGAGDCEDRSLPGPCP